MIGRSFPEYVFIRLSVFALRLITPASTVYLAACWYTSSWPISPWLAVYPAAEVAFYLLVYLPRVWLLQKDTTHPPLLTQDERKYLFAKCFARISHADLAAGWFYSSPQHEIRRDNLVEWLLWALFSTDTTGRLDEWEEELTEYVSAMEGLLGHTFEPGRNDAVTSMRLTLDPVVSLHRPLLWYSIVGLVDTFTVLSLYRHGFQHFSLRQRLSCFPYRPFTLFSKTSVAPQVSYWYRPHKSSTKKPILFFHGIGIGLYPYVPFLADLLSVDPDVGIIAVEILSISMRMSPAPLDRALMLEATTHILDLHSFAEFVLVGHSYGTIIAAHMLRDPALSTRVAATLLVDPIPFLLHLPAVAYNFVYRPPRSANEWQLWYFTSRDLDISRTLSRHFFWAQNILWKEDLSDRRIAVVLSGRDQIVDTREVWQYLTGEALPGPMSSTSPTRWQKDNLEVLYYSDLDHANVFDTAALRQPIVGIITKFSETDDTST